MEPRLAEATAGQRAVFFMFMDAAHFVWAPFLGVLWCFTRLFIKAPAGRLRVNVLAALNATSHQLFTLQNLTYITYHLRDGLPIAMAVSGRASGPATYIRASHLP